jgi:hypothetical protein
LRLRLFGCSGHLCCVMLTPLALWKGLNHEVFDLLEGNHAVVILVHSFEYFLKGSALCITARRR